MGAGTSRPSSLLSMPGRNVPARVARGEGIVMARAVENKDFTLDDFLYAQSDTKPVESPVAD